MDEDQLASALRSRTPAAMQELVHSFGDRLLRSAYLLCGNSTDAQDLVQETFVQAWQSAHRFRNASTVYTWLHGILLNLSRHYHRKRKRMVADGEMPEVATDAPDDFASAESNAALVSALSQLPDTHREVVVLRFYEDLKIEEIAARLSLSKGTVKSRLHYAMAKLKNLLPTNLNLFIL